MPHFFLKLIPPRPTFALDMNDEERTLMAKHAAYWKAKLNGGDVLVFGPVLDPKGPYGAGIISAADEGAARAFADADPVISSNRGFICEIHPMQAVVRDARAAS
jgi:uncharacterized protein YciI